MVTGKIDYGDIRCETLVGEQSDWKRTVRTLPEDTREGGVSLPQDLPRVGENLSGPSKT